MAQFFVDFQGTQKYPWILNKLGIFLLFMGMGPQNYVPMNL